MLLGRCSVPGSPLGPPSVSGLSQAQQALQRGLVSGWPPLMQFLVALIVLDLIQWSVHNLLHRVPWLWRFHQVHHSIEVLDWAGNLRFHWMEVVIYRSAPYVPLALLSSPAPGEPLRGTRTVQPPDRRPTGRQREGRSQDPPAAGLDAAAHPTAAAVRGCGPKPVRFLLRAF